MRRTHNLLELLSEAERHDSRFGAFGELAAALMAQFWAQHYPGGDLTDVGADYDSLREQVGRLVELILGSPDSRSGAEEPPG